MTLEQAKKRLTEGEEALNAAAYMAGDHAEADRSGKTLDERLLELHAAAIVYAARWAEFKYLSDSAG